MIEYNKNIETMRKDIKKSELKQIIREEIEKIKIWII